MADLDDFFAKKDKKKKGKKGSKFAKANTDILAQNLIENDKKTEDDEKKAATLLATSEANRAGAAKDNPGAEEEWKDYEEEKKDFSNLKIETLTVESDPEDDKEEEHEINEETGEKVRVKKGDSAGPWNKVAGTGAKSSNEESSIEKDIEQPPAPTKKEEDVSKTRSSYVPPHLRGGSSTTDTDRRPTTGRMPRGAKNAPDLNAINFPSLSDSTGINDNSKGMPRSSEEKEFETARGGGNQQQRVSEAPKLITTNKFSALRN